MSESATPWTVACQASLSLAISQSLPKFMSVASMMPSGHLILWRPLLLLPSIFPSTRGFSKLGGHGHPHFTDEETAAQVKPESESRAALVWSSSTSYHSRATRCPIFCWCLSMSHKLRAWLWVLTKGLLSHEEEDKQTGYQAIIKACTRLLKTDWKPREMVWKKESAKNWDSGQIEILERLECWRVRGADRQQRCEWPFLQSRQ